jgi:hypothetical protein
MRKIEEKQYNQAYEEAAISEDTENNMAFGVENYNVKGKP